jgi:hypothetical protein
MKKLITIVCCIFSLSAQAQTIEFVNRDWQDVKSPIIKVDFNGKDRLFMVDSGSAISVLDESCNMPDGKLMASAGTKVATINGSVVNNGHAYKDKVFGRNVVFFTKDLSYINAMYADCGIRIYGILGADWLLGRRVVVDYNSRVLVVNN